MNYREPVGGIGVRELPERITEAMKELEARFPKLGVTLMVFDFGESGGMAYGSNANRADMVRAMLEFIDKNIGSR